MSKLNVVIGMSEQLKDALDIYAQSKKRSTADVVRTAIADMIGYDLKAEKANSIERRGRPKVYATEAERKAAVAQRAKEQRAEARRLVDQYRQQQARRDMAAFRKSVEDKLGPIT